MNIALVLLIFIFIHSSRASKILGIFPTPSISHQIGLHALVKDLAARGHEITVLTTDVIKISNPNVTQIDLHSAYDVFKKEFKFVEFSQSDMDEADFIEFFSRLTAVFLDEELSHPEVRKLIIEKDKHHFDVLIIEQIFYTPLLAFAELYDIPAIGVSTTDIFNDVHEMIGNSANSVLHPEVMFPFVQGMLSLDERWKCLKYFIKNRIFIQPGHNRRMKEVVQKHFPMITPDLNRLNKRINFVMINANPAMGYVRPILPNTIQLGFMHIEPPKTLQEGPLKEFLDNSKHGVIYMSFGSNVQSKDLKIEIKQMFLDVFGSLKYDVLWKFEDDNLPNRPKNVMIQKWLPQADLLAHPKIKLFITQGGQQSMEEAIDRAVPTILIPFLGDQTGNAKRMEQRNVGKYLDLTTLTKEKFESTIHEMLKPQYKENIKKLRDLVYDQPLSPREKAVWWTEYVIRHKGAKHFHYIGNDVPFYQKYYLDFAAMALSFLTIISLTAYYIIVKVVSICVIQKKKTE